jgi:hypothetical protein
MCSFQDSGCGRRASPLPDAPDQRSDLNAARISSLKSCGCSQAAKWPPLSTSLWAVLLTIAFAMTALVAALAPSVR